VAARSKSEWLETKPTNTEHSQGQPGRLAARIKGVIAKIASGNCPMIGAVLLYQPAQKQAFWIKINNRP
jgi:hypothetical protein